MVTQMAASDRHLFRAYFQIGPDDPRAGLIVVQEIFGLNRHVRGLCDRLAAEGFNVISPALFDRAEKTGTYGVELEYDEIERGKELAAKVGYVEAPLLDLEACRRWFRPGTPVGVVGFCWGGTLAWAAAQRLKVRAAVGYYGGMLAKMQEPPPQCPVMLHFGEADSFVPIDQVGEIRNATVHTYPAGHGFNCEERSDFHPPSAALAWQRTLEFLRKELQ